MAQAQSITGGTCPSFSGKRPDTTAFSNGGSHTQLAAYPMVGVPPRFRAQLKVSDGQPDSLDARYT